MEQHQSDKCNVCKLPKGTRVYNLLTEQRGTVTRSRSDRSVSVLWDDYTTSIKHDSSTHSRCSSIEEIEEADMGDENMALAIGTRANNIATERKGVVTSRDHTGASIRVRYDGADSDNTIDSSQFGGLEVIENLEGESKPETTSIETYLSSNVTSRRGQRLAEHAEVIKKR